jgi:hypothetical protein
VSAPMLQRVVVRMLFDAEFRDRVYANPEAALHDVPLTAAERQWVVTPPPQAYGTDPYRQSRALSGLLEEYPVAGALAVRCPQGVARLQRFFASAAFHDCVQQRGSMAAAFGSYLQSVVFAAAPTVARMALVEAGGVQVRRAPPSVPATAGPYAADTRLCIAPWVALLAVPPTTLSHYSQVLQRLQQHGPVLLDAVLDTTYRLPAGPRVPGAASAWILVVRDATGAGFSLEEASPELAALVAAAHPTSSFGALCALAVRLGAERQEAVDILEGLVTDQLLIRVPSMMQPKAVS